MQRIAAAAEEMLRARLLPFWKALRDDEFGGYYGYMDFDHRLDKKAEKGCVLNSRILWFFSQAAMTLKDDSLIPYARHAYDFLREKCLDREFGGVYWSMTYDGKPLDGSKHTYCQAFAIYGLSAYYRLTGEEEALRLARRLFALIEEACADEGGYVWPQIALVELPFPLVLKNAALLFLGQLPRSLAALAILAVVFGLGIQYFYVSVTLLPFVNFWLPVFPALFLIYPAINGAFKIEETLGGK